MQGQVPGAWRRARPEEGAVDRIDEGAPLVSAGVVTTE